METVRTKKRKKNLSYNALRGIAALGIFFSHMSYLKASDTQFWSGLYTFFMRHGSVCCSVFYILSGFLAVYTWRNSTFREYFTRKLKKNYPLVFYVLVLAVALDYVMSRNAVINEGVSAGSPQWWFNILMGVTMLKAFIPYESTFYSFHGPSWYFSGLVVFWVLAYFIVPKLVGAITDIKDAQNAKDNLLNNNNLLNHSNQKLAVGWVTVICAVAYAVQAVICIYIDVKQLSDIRLWATYVNPWFRIFGECFLGMIIACHIEDMKLTKNSSGKLKVFAIVFAFAVILLRNVMATSLWSAWIYALPISLLLISFYNDEGKVAGVLKAKPFQFLGDISFELYMTHAFVYEGLPIAVGIVSTDFKGWLVYHAGTRFIITMALAIVFAWMVQMVFGLVRKKSSSKIGVSV